jgi:hypothetical protein
MSKINNIGTYNSISDLWNKHPEGGIEGDYATIGATIYEWDKYQDKWVGATDTSSSDTTSTETQESSQNASTEQSGNSDTPITNQEINFLGQFDTISDVWEKFPEGGHEGDYVTIGDSEHKYWWNKYTCLWDDTTESGNKDNGEKGNDVTIEGQELNDLGTFTSIDDLWDKHPEGGKEGDIVMVGTTKYYWNKYTRQWTDNPITTKTDLPTSIINPDDTPANPEFINDKGTFTSLDDAWQKYPAGGNTGDYITIGDSRYWWNSYINQWQKEGTSIQSATSKQYVLDGNTEIEGTAKTDEDMNVGRNLNVNGTSNIHGNENISGDQAIKGSQSIEEDSKINGDLTVDGTIHNKNIDDKLDDLKVYEESTRKIIGQNINDGLANGTVKQANYADEAGQADEADGLTKIGLDKTDSRYLRKDVPDTASGMISFLQGIQIGNNFETGTSGCVIRIDADGKTYAEVDKLYVRLKAVFDTLEIRKFQGSTGNRIVSNATAIVTRIEVVKDVNGNISGYRCFFKGTDGDKTISNDFIIGDFAFCKESNAKGIHYYWRKITDINVSPNTNNELSIVLSASDCDTDSDVPQVQDNIIQLGSLDTTRQGAIIEYTSGEDSPSYKIYQNINSYSLADKDVLGLGYNSGSNKAYMNVYGDAYIGDKNGGDFIKYDPEIKKVTIKGELLVTANQTLTQLLDQYSTSDAMEKAISKAQTSAEKNANDYSDKALGSAQKALLEKISDLGKSLGNYSYLLDALKQDTSVEGGLLQTSLLSLGYTDSEGARHTMAGTNGIPTAGSEGQSIAAWYGGEMIDRQQYDATKTSHYNDKATIDDNAARTLFRMDGSGYTAKGNLTWDERGILTIKQVTWGNEDIKNFFNAFSVGLLNDKLQITPKGDFTTLTVNGEKVLTLNTLMEDTTYWGATMISGKVTGDINIGGKLYIGYDTTNDAVVFYKSTDGGKTKEAANVYSLGGLSAFGANTNISSGGSGTSYDRLDKWSDYTVDKATDVLSALLGNDLNERLKKVEAGALTAVDWSIITSIPTINGTSLKGSSVVTAKWGTERMLTIGQTAKSVDGSENVAWSLVEIGAAAASHTHVWKDITDHPTAVSAFTNDAGYTTNKGTVTSVGLSVPTGLSVSGSPVTVSGTLAIALETGYSIPTTAKQGNWDVAYTNNHTHTNKTILDGITSAKINNWDSVYTWYESVTTTDTDTVINKWQEIIKFLDGISSSTDLNAIISGINSSISNEVTRAKAAESANASNITALQGYFTSGSAKTAVKLLTARSLWGNSFDGTADINGNITMKSDDGTYIQIGGARIVYDKTNSALYVVGADGKTSANFYSTGGVSAFGANTNSGSGGSGTSYDRLDKWSDYTADKATDVLSALLGNDLNTRVSKLEGTTLTSVDWSIIANKPSTFAPSAHTHLWADITDRPTLLSQFTDNILSGHYLPLSGGLMSGTAIIQFTDSGTWGKSGVTYPVQRGGLYWTGESDWVKLFAEETGVDNLDLILQFGDDNSNKLQIRNASGVQTAYISATGVFGGSLSGNASSASKVNNALSWSGYSSGAFDGSAAKSISIPNDTNQLSNGAGFITSAASISGNAAKLDIPIATSIDNSDNSFYACYAAGSNSVTTKPAGVDGFGLIGLRVAAGWYGQILMADSYDMFYRNGNGISSSTAWKRLLDSGNYSSFALPLHGTADTSTKFASAQVISLTGDITGSASSQAGWNIATAIGAGKVTNSMLAGGIDNSKLAHSTITIAGITIALGGSVAADSITSAASKLGLVTKGSANQAIYLNAGIPTVCSYTFGNGNGNVPVSNGTVNSNLNADMLDGYHYTDINRYAIAYWKSGWYKVAEVTNAVNSERFIVFDVVNSDSSSHAILYLRGRANGTPSMTCAYNLNFDISQFRLYYDGYRYTLYAYIPGDWQGKVFRVINEGQEGNGQKSWDLFSYSSNVDPKALDSESSTTYIIPQYAGVGYSATKLCRNSDASLPMTFNWSGQSGQPSWLWGGNDGTNMYVYNPSNFNVYSTVKLQTARTLWGQSFDGTGNVDGQITINGNAQNSDFTGLIINGNRDYHSGDYGTVSIDFTLKESATPSVLDRIMSKITSGHECDYDSSRGFMSFYTRSGGSVSEKMRLSSSGNLGIGTTSPAYKLDVNGTLHAAGATILGSTLDIAGLTHIGGTLELYNLLTFNLAEGHFGTSYGYTDPWSGLGASFKFGGSVAMVAAYVNGLVHAAGPVILDSTLNVKGVSAFGNYISMGSNRINFGTLNSTGWGYAFYADDGGMNIDCTSESLKTLGIYADTVTVNGNFLSTGGVTAYTSSDRRLKMNIQPINSLAVIRTLGGTYQFDWRKDGRHSIGFIAQNVQRSQLSSMVYNGKDGYLKLNYLDTRLISLALGASMQLDDEVIRLKKKVASLEKEVETLKQAS